MSNIIKNLEAFGASILEDEKPVEDRLLKDMKILSNVSDGARTKLWVESEDKVKYLYKKSKINTFGEYTFEHVSEYIAMLISRALDIPCCNVLCGNNAILSQVMWSENLKSFIELSEEMSHSFHMSNLETYNISTLLREQTNPYYKETVLMLLFDAFIGNSDRHPGNFMYNDNKGFYPLFDNGSSLCSYIRDYEVKNILRDGRRFEAINITKSKPVLRDEQKITHKQLVSILYKQYPTICKEFGSKVRQLDMSKILLEVSTTDLHKEIVYKFVEYRRKWFDE